MNQWNYPLPKKSLIKRYSPLFQALFSRRSVTYWTVPHSCATSHLKFVLSELESLPQLKRFIPGNFQFVWLDFNELTSLSESSFHFLLARQIHKVLGQPFENPTNATSDLLFSNLISTLERVFDSSDLVLNIILNDYDLSQWPQLWGRNLYRLWSTHRRHPDNRINLVYLTQPHPSTEHLPAFLDPLSISYFETIRDYPLFDDQETLYSYQRLNVIHTLKLNNRDLRYLAQTCSGYYELFLPAIEIFQKHPHDFEDALISNPLIMGRLSQVSLIQNQYPLLSERLGLYHCHFVESAIPKNSQSIQGINLNQDLTSSESSLLMVLLSKPGEIIPRAEVIRIVWGDEADISDWALDQLISRLKKKLHPNSYGQNPIQTLRGRGIRIVR